jgi:hypothetical protein
VRIQICNRSISLTSEYTRISTTEENNEFEIHEWYRLLTLWDCSFGEERLVEKFRNPNLMANTKKQNAQWVIQWLKVSFLLSTVDILTNLDCLL